MNRWIFIWRLTMASCLWLVANLFCLANVERHAGPSTWRADPHYLIDAWETEDGLPENSASAIVQTSDGYLWFGTFAGLVRFDGVAMTVFNQANTPPLPSDGIVNLHLDQKDRLWVSTYEGLAVREHQEWRQVTSIQAGAADYARSFTGRPNGDLLMTTFSGKLFQISGDTITELPSPPGERGQGYLGGVDEDGHWWVVQNQFIGRWENERWVRMISTEDEKWPRDAVGCGPAQDGGLWLLLGKELRKWNRGRESSRLTLPETPGGVWGLREDRSGHVWIATYNQGFCRVSTNASLLRWTGANGVSDSGRCIFEDREGNLWMGTSGGGLLRFTQRRFQHFQRDGGRQEFLVRSVWSDASGEVWAATYGRGLFQLATSGFTKVDLPNPANRVLVLQSVLVDRAGRWWIGTAGDGLWIVEEGVPRQVPISQSGGHNVLALFEDSLGRVWVSGGGGIARHDASSFRSFGSDLGVTGAVIHFAEDVSGRIWFSNFAGVFRQQPNGAFAEITVNGESLSGIYCLKSDANGSLWLGSADRGLLRWKDGRIAILNPETGLPVNRVQSIVEDRLGYFWMTSLRTLVRARRSDLHSVADGAQAHLVCQEFGSGDGLPKGEFSSARQPVSSQDNQGRLWFATTKGVTMTDPARLQLNDVPPPVHIEAVVFQPPLKHLKDAAHLNSLHRPGVAPRHRQGFSARERDAEIRFTAPFPSPLLLPAGSRRLEIHYTATSFTSPDRVRFQVKLNGQETTWEEAPPGRVMSYYDPLPGTYAFQVRAANNDGVWNESSTELAFTVLPFFWQTWWFRIGVVALLFSSGGGIAWWRGRVTHQRHLEELETSRRHQAELTHFGRVSTMGQLASSLAHELNQPLGAILRNAEAAELFLQRDPPDLEEIRAIIADIRHDDRRAGDIIDRMRSLLKKREFHALELDANTLTREVGTLVRPDAETRNIALSVHLSPTLAVVWGDRVQLQQVLLNLLLNAMDAMDGRSGKRSLCLSVRQVPAGVEWSISDTGHGIPNEHLNRLFDPFFTTKPQGMGMGLPISQTIISAHGGRLTAENNPDGGATFRVTLPNHGTEGPTS